MTGILVADDEASLREICREALQDFGYTVFEAKNGEQALHILREEDEVELVLSDMRMPVMDGMQLLERIIQEKLDIDFLVMTGFGTIETAVEIMKKGAVDYLPKPFYINHLQLKVEKALEQRRERKERASLNKLVRVLKLSKDLNTKLELSTLLNEFIFHLERNFEPASSGIFLYREDSLDLQLVRAQGNLIRSDPKSMSLFRRIGDLVLQQGGSKLIDPYVLESDPEVRFVSEEASFSWSLMAAPMLSKDQKIGVVILVRDQKQPLYTKDDLQLLSVFCSQTASLIENARLYGQMRDMNREVIRSFAQAVEAKDIYTRGHSDQVAYYATKLGRSLSLSKHELNNLYLAGIVHDIGKIGVPDHILNKPDSLTDEEFTIMKRHPEVGRNILAQVASLQEILPTIYHHHERIDGRGYPEGLRDEQIPFLSKVIGVVDAFEAMTSDRAYRQAMSWPVVKDILLSGAGTQWDRELVNRWLEIVEREQLTEPLAAQGAAK
jgi:response regulator RpfG family c-di-GMP phosphodiesterase